VDVWPKAFGGAQQTDDGFCARIEKLPDATLPFTAVHDANGKTTAVPYSEAYRAQMSAVSTELIAAADALNGANEEPLVAYLRAAAESFSRGISRRISSWARSFQNTATGRRPDKRIKPGSHSSRMTPPCDSAPRSRNFPSWVRAKPSWNRVAKLTLRSLNP